MPKEAEVTTEFNLYSLDEKMKYSKNTDYNFLSIYRSVSNIAFCLVQVSE